MLAAGIVFALTYLVLSFPNIPGIHLRRPAAALLGAVAMVVLGVVKLDEAYRLVDLDTLVFILGMMIVIGYLEISGFFEAVETLVLERARTTRALAGLVILCSGLLSALFMNDTICLMLTPLLVRMLRRAGRPMAPYLIALATSSNIGSAMTPMGNPQNMIVAIHSRVPFLEFAGKLLPVALLGLVANFAILVRLYPAELASGIPFDAGERKAPPRRGRLFWVCQGAVLLLLALFALDVHPPLVAISVAALLILAGATRPRTAFEHVDWELLLMFAGLFVVMGGVRESGLLAHLLDPLTGAAGWSLSGRITILSVAAAALSNVVSNVPAVIFLVNAVPDLGGERNLWLALAAASTFAGNLTIIGSVANLIVFEGAKDDVQVGFREYFRAGAPLALALVVIGALWLALIG